jgi:hypothetical protein
MIEPSSWNRHTATNQPEGKPSPALLPASANAGLTSISISIIQKVNKDRKKGLLARLWHGNMTFATEQAISAAEVGISIGLLLAHGTLGHPKKRPAAARS